MAKIQLARVLPGAVFAKTGVSDTYTGLILKVDGTQRHCYIKDLDKTELANELLVSVLATTLGLPTPEIFLGLASGSDFPATKGPMFVTGERLVFVSADVCSPNLAHQLQTPSNGQSAKALLATILSWPELGRLYAFDAWVANTDRHQGNLLLGGTGKVWLIDHGRCFTGPDWDVSQLLAQGLFANRLGDWATTELTGAQRTDRAKEALAFSAVIAAIDVPAAAQDSLVDKIIPPNLVSAVKTFLVDRMKYVPKNANIALGSPLLVS